MPPEADDGLFEGQRERVDNPIRRLFAEYGRENTFEFVVGALASVTVRVLDLMPPVVLGLTINAIIRQETSFAAGFPVLPETWITPYVPAARDGQFLLAVGIIVFSFTAGAMFHWLRNWGQSAYVQQIQHDVRAGAYDRMQLLNMGFFADKQTGGMMSILSSGVNHLKRFLNDGMGSFFRLFVMVVTITVVPLSYGWQLAPVALLPVPLITFFAWKFVDITQPKYADVCSSVGKLNSRLENNLGGIQVIKTFNAESHESNCVNGISTDYFDANWDVINTRIKFFPAFRILAGINFSLTFVVGGLQVINGQGPGPFTGDLEIGKLVIFILLAQQFVWPLAQFGQIINMYQRAHASNARIFGLTDEPTRLAEQPGAPDLAVSENRVKYGNVVSGYGDGEIVVEDISFEVDGGKTLALVDPTGGGKSTTLKLLMRVYNPDEGHVNINGQNIRNVTISSLRESIAYVSQKTFLFYGTVHDNITCDTFDADDETVIIAAKAAEVHEFILNLPEGYDTEVGEHGVKFSGGQCQRISIARAILKDPDILAPDETTSDVDTETGMLIQRSLDGPTVDRTTFSITHRLSTIKNAEQIVILKDGRIVERGTHDGLLSEDDLYAHFWGVQVDEIDQLPDELVERAARRQVEINTGDG